MDSSRILDHKTRWITGYVYCTQIGVKKNVGKMSTLRGFEKKISLFYFFQEMTQFYDIISWNSCKKTGIGNIVHKTVMIFEQCMRN